MTGAAWGVLANILLILFLIFLVFWLGKKYSRIGVLGSECEEAFEGFLVIYPRRIEGVLELMKFVNSGYDEEIASLCEELIEASSEARAEIESYILGKELVTVSTVMEKIRKFEGLVMGVRFYAEDNVQCVSKGFESAVDDFSRKMEDLKLSEAALAYGISADKLNRFLRRQPAAVRDLFLNFEELPSIGKCSAAGYSMF